MLEFTLACARHFPQFQILTKAENRAQCNFQVVRESVTKGSQILFEFT